MPRKKQPEVEFITPEAPTIRTKLSIADCRFVEGHTGKMIRCSLTWATFFCRPGEAEPYKVFGSTCQGCLVLRDHEGVVRFRPPSFGKFPVMKVTPDLAMHVITEIQKTRWFERLGEGYAGKAIMDMTTEGLPKDIEVDLETS